MEVATCCRGTGRQRKRQAPTEICVGRADIVTKGRSVSFSGVSDGGREVLFVRLNGSQLSAAQHVTAAARQDFPTGTHHSSIRQGKPSHAGTFFCRCVCRAGRLGRAQGTGHSDGAFALPTNGVAAASPLAAGPRLSPLAPRPSPRAATWALFSANVSARARARSLVRSARAQRPWIRSPGSSGSRPRADAPATLTGQHRHGGSRRKSEFPSCGANANGDNNNNNNNNIH